MNSEFFNFGARDLMDSNQLGLNGNVVQTSNGKTVFSQKLFDLVPLGPEPKLGNLKILTFRARMQHQNHNKQVYSTRGGNAASE